MLKFNDTKSRSLVDFTPREPGKIAIYACGPTVYDEPHIGHARTALTYDVIRRYLSWRGFDVKLVMNITDIDDKIIARAAQERRTTQEVAQEYEAVYFEQMDRLGIRRADACPRATEHLSGMIQIIEELVERDVGYVIEGAGVYFEVSKFGQYGQLVGQDPEVLLEGSGVRVELDERKRNPQDFALWKAAKEGEPAWDSPWMPGRPGWHIECVAMSLSLLGENFDIHGGGTDLVFPHHENELAQARAAGYSFARHWIHSAMVNIDGEKMAKSKQNFLTLRGLLDEWPPEAVRLAMLQTHYRTVMELTENSLNSAVEGLERIKAFLRVADRAALNEGDTGGGVSEAMVPAAAEFRQAMDNDFNTPQALAAVFDAVRQGNVALKQGQAALAKAACEAVRELCQVLGLLPAESEAGGPGKTPEESEEIAAIELLVSQRQQARESKDFQAADRLREQLKAEYKVEVEDTPQGPVWRRV